MMCMVNVQYGIKTWTDMAKKLSALSFDMWTYWRMLKISWTEKVTNEEV